MVNIGQLISDISKEVKTNAKYNAKQKKKKDDAFVKRAKRFEKKNAKNDKKRPTKSQQWDLDNATTPVERKEVINKGKEFERKKLGRFSF